MPVSDTFSLGKHWEFSFTVMDSRQPTLAAKSDRWHHTLPLGGPGCDCRFISSCVIIQTRSQLIVLFISSNIKYRCI